MDFSVDVAIVILKNFDWLVEYPIRAKLDLLSILSSKAITAAECLHHRIGLCVALKINLILLQRATDKSSKASNSTVRAI